jgi:hypothetical protein
VARMQFTTNGKRLSTVIMRVAVAFFVASALLGCGTSRPLGAVPVFLAPQIFPLLSVTCSGSGVSVGAAPEILSKCHVGSYIVSESKGRGVLLCVHDTCLNSQNLESAKCQPSNYFADRGVA